MALTIPSLGKALEDVTKALNKNTSEIGTIRGAYDRQIKTLERTVKIQQAAFTLSDFLPKDVTVDTASTEQKETAQKTLDELVQKQESYHNVIRNKNGSISVPESHDTTDAVNKKYVDDRLAAHQIILESRMPLNPVCTYDMADIQNEGNKIYTLPMSLTVNNTPEIISGKTIYSANDEGSYYHIHSEMSFTGNAKPIVIVYRTDWKEGTEILWQYCNGTQDFTIFIPKQNFSFGIGVWMHGWGGYQVQPGDSVTAYKFTVTKLTDRVLIDSSGNSNHATVSGGVIQKGDDMVGISLDCTKGFIKRKPLDCIGVGKKWSHSRWIKINEHTQDKTVNIRPWIYGQYDYAIMDIAGNNGVVSDISLLCYKDDQNLHTFYIGKAQIIDNQWHNLIVMTDLQKTYCRRIFYLDGKKIGEKRVEANFENFPPTNECSEMASLTGSLANQLFFDRFLTESEILWLSRNSYYPAKRYSLAEYKADENRKILETLKK